MAAARRGQTVNQAELASIFGVSTNTIRSWDRQGCPTETKGARGQAFTYNTASVIDWREAQILLAATGTASAMDYLDARRRKMIADARLAEIELDLKEGAVVEIETIADAVVREYATARNKLLGIPTKIAPRLAPLRDPNAVRAALEAEIVLALNELTADENLTDRKAAR